MHALYDGDSLTMPELPVGEFEQILSVICDSKLEPAMNIPAVRNDSDTASLHEEFFEAVRIQRRLSGPRRLQRGAFDVATETFAARHVSGDFFTAFDIGDKTVLALGDITGKGLAAGMWFAHVVGLVRLCANTSDDPAAILKCMNDEMCRPELPVPITTLFLAILNTKLNEIAYCNAGHPSPLLFHSNRQCERLDRGGPLLGAVREAQFQSGRVRIAQSDTLLAYSDGLVETRNDHDDEFGQDRLLQHVADCVGMPSSATVYSVIGALRDFAGNRDLQDDVTVMAITLGDAE